MSLHGPPISTTVEPSELEKLMELIDAHPQRAELSVSFRRAYLEALLLQCGSAHIALEKLSSCLKAYENLKEIEDKMFVLLPHYFIASLK